MMNMSRIPDHMHDAVKRYVFQGIHPGGFLEAVLANDLVGAACRADHVNAQRLRDWAVFACNELPSQCWGSYPKVERWLDGEWKQWAGSERGDRG